MPFLPGLQTPPQRRAVPAPYYRYLAAEMNWLNDSHHTMTVV